MDISERAFSSTANQTEENLDFISITLDNLVDSIEAENITVNTSVSNDYTLCSWINVFISDTGNGVIPDRKYI